MITEMYRRGAEQFWSFLRFMWKHLDNSISLEDFEAVKKEKSGLEARVSTLQSELAKTVEETIASQSQLAELRLAHQQLTEENSMLEREIFREKADNIENFSAVRKLVARYERDVQILPDEYKGMTEGEKFAYVLKKYHITLMLTKDNAKAVIANRRFVSKEGTEGAAPSANQNAGYGLKELQEHVFGEIGGTISAVPVGCLEIALVNLPLNIESKSRQLRSVGTEKNFLEYFQDNSQRDLFIQDLKEGGLFQGDYIMKHGRRILLCVPVETCYQLIGYRMYLTDPGVNSGNANPAKESEASKP